MGEVRVKFSQTRQDKNHFIRQLLRDVEALDAMLHAGLFEKDRQRIGAEQELCLINAQYNPCLCGPEILEKATDPHLTSEIGRFNLELNLDPVEIRPDCLRSMERQLVQLLGMVEMEASHEDARVLLTGILPTLHIEHLQSGGMTPLPRYQALSQAVHAMRGKDFEIHILGVNELIASLDSILFEACNTSFQTHLQVAPEDFVRLYNWAQYISGPVLAASANSPLLFGRQLWMETRIALFQQSVDSRSSSNHLREKIPRVHFGDHWLQHSVAEFFKDNIARFPLILTKEIEEDAMDCLQQGAIPSLPALRLHNGTVYTWNRPCYGISEGQPHLRIECRYIPSGPTVADEMANFAFWLGLMLGMPSEYHGFEQKMPFRFAKMNFLNAARSGLDSIFIWQNRAWNASDLILRELLPIAANGLKKIKLNTADVARYLTIIEDRIMKRQNGALWQVFNFHRLRESYGVSAAANILTQEMYARQESGQPVSDWPDIVLNGFFQLTDTVEQVMKTDLFTVQGDEPVELAKDIMLWKKIRHLPVENAAGELIGLLSATNLQEWEERTEPHEQLIVRDIMTQNLITVPPETSVQDALQQMKSKQIGCLPIVRKNKMVGLVTDTDFKRLNRW